MLTEGMFFLSMFCYHLFRLTVGRHVHAALRGTRAYVGDLPMTYDLEVILKYSKTANNRTTGGNNEYNGGPGGPGTVFVVPGAVF